VANLAYYFTFEYEKPQNVEVYTRPLANQVEFWREAYEESDLFSVDKEEYLLIWDLRKGSKSYLKVLTGLQKILYIACDCIYSINKLKKLAESYSDKQISEAEVEDILNPLVNAGLMIKEDNNYLSLAISLATYSPKRAILEKLQKVIESFGSVSDDKVVINLNM
jgi:hypothetical protein